MDQGTDDVSPANAATMETSKCSFEENSFEKSIDKETSDVLQAENTVKTVEQDEVAKDVETPSGENDDVGQTRKIDSNLDVDTISGLSLTMDAEPILDNTTSHSEANVEMTADVAPSAEIQDAPEILDAEKLLASKDVSTNETVPDISIDEASNSKISKDTKEADIQDKVMEVDQPLPSPTETRDEAKDDEILDDRPNEKVGTSDNFGEEDNGRKTDSTNVDNNSEISELKDSLAEKNVVEPENTEFVQISQEDKHDESQIENQSTENDEDPFGGDNLNSENLDQLETENLAGEIADFQKLGDQADNLQDVVKAKDNQEMLKENSGDETSRDDLVQAVDTDDIESENEGRSTLSTVEKIQDQIVATERNSESKKLSDQEESSEVNEIPGKEVCDDDKTSKDGEKSTKDSSLATSEVLPGQDDELCIIPDSMKVVTENAKDAAKSKENAETVPESDKPVSDDESSKDTEVVEKLPVDIEKNLTIMNVASVMDSTNEKRVAVTVEDEVPQAIARSSTTDIIDLDEESKNSEIEEITTKETCKQCNEERACKIKVKVGLDCFNVCSKECRNLFKAANNRATDIPSEGVNSKREKRCAACLLIVEINDERNLSWETMEFCNEECLGKFQTKYGSYCRNCNGSVQAVSLGKYCVRFGYDVRQFCCSLCLEEFKKGLKVCSYCQKDISSGTEGFLAPVGDKGQFKDFCTQDCMEKYSRMSSSEPPVSEMKSCGVCQEEKIVHCEVQIDGGGPVAICSDPCFAAFKFVNKVDPDQCSTCKKFFQLLSKKNFVVFYEGESHMFCNKTCLNVFIITNRKIVPCNWCKVKKYNFDMIKKELKTGQVMMMCSLNCLTLYQVSINAVSARRINCDFCKEFSQAQYHLTMSDATIRNFCSYNCVMNFQSQYTKSPITIPSSDDPVPTGIPKRTVPTRSTLQKPNDLQNQKTLPVISSVTSLASIGNGQVCSPTTQQNSVSNIPTNVSVQTQPPQVIYKQQVITRPPSPIKLHNKMTQCKPITHTKGVSVRPHPCTKATQTDEQQQIIVPIPVPIYVPFPMHMFSMPFPVPFPFPLPIPVPIFIPTTRNSAKGIFKDIKRIQEKIPADPFEAELLMMAEMVATEKKTTETDSDSDDEHRVDVADVPANATGDAFIPEGVDSSNTFGDDMLQMALKMATGELDEPAVDLEAALTPTTITATQTSSQQDSSIDVQPERLISAPRGRKRMVPYKPRSTPTKRGRRVSNTNDLPLMPPPESQPPTQPRIMEPMEKPDANMALKYTFGVNAWRQWVVAKNCELEKQNTPTRRVKLFKTELLQLTADELNYSLCLFVKEVRKPNGSEYAPDTIYYLCLGIQQYLFENNRIDNIFTDSYYEKFTDCLNDVAKKFSVLYNDAQYIVTRVEEEHLWESKQLGAHSPHVLLSTLMFFNTKHFNLVTVEEHMQLSFSHIMKHWKRNPAAQPAAVAGKVPGSRNVLLRFYPPQSALEANSRKKKVYEQQENEDNPLRCPVKLYEFYLSKCPESVKTRNDVFYLLPERSCVPDSPVWYSTSALAKEHLIKMLYRVKMVKEINVALLTS